MKHRAYILTSFWIGVFALVFSGCVGKYKMEPVRSEPNFIAGYLQYTSQKNKPNFSHPAKLDLQELELMLSFLVVKDTKAGRSNKPRKIFLAEEISVLAPELQNLLAKATHDQSVFFAYERMRGPGVALFKLITSGQVYMRGDKLHLVFGDLQREDMNGEGLKLKQLSLGDPGKTPRKSWVILENARVKYADLPGQPGLKNKNAVVIGPEAKDKAILAGEGESVTLPAAAAATAATPEKSLEQKLTELKDLHAKGLIDDKEYKAAKQKLLSGI